MAWTSCSRACRRTTPDAAGGRCCPLAGGRRSQSGCGGTGTPTGALGRVAPIYYYFVSQSQSNYKSRTRTEPDPEPDTTANTVTYNVPDRISNSEPDPGSNTVTNRPDLIPPEKERKKRVPRLTRPPSRDQSYLRTVSQ